MRKILSITLLLLFIGSTGIHAQISIADARTKADGSTVQVNGIITADEFGQLKYIQDATSGIGLYSSNTSGLQKGDSVSITGVIKDYNGELEISPVSSFSVITTGKPLPAPKVLSFDDGFKEAYEGQLVRFNDIRFVATGTFDGGTSGNNYDITQGTVQKEVRILPQTNIPGTAIPSDKVDIIGVMGHYKNTYGTNKYQLKPRSVSDILLGKGPIINSKLKQYDILPYSFSLEFTTENEGKALVKYGLTKELESGTISNSTNTKEHHLQLTGLSSATFYYVQAMAVDMNFDTSKTGLYLFSTASLSSGEIKVYFNRSVDQNYSYVKDAVFLDHSIDDTLVAYINRAKKSIDVAVYNLNNAGFTANISQALNNAHNRGVVVRLIGDGSTANLGLNDISGPSVLKSPTSAVYGIMHNKFFVFDANSNNPDEAIVWTGSTNLTENQVHVDPNNVIIIQDQALAKAYTLEFEEMWGSSGKYPDGIKSKFGSFKTDNTPHFFNIGGELVELYFSPSDQVQTEIIKTIESCDYSTYFGVYTFTRTEISNALIQQHNAGRYVAGIFGDNSGSSATPYNNLVSAIGASKIKAYSQSHIYHHKLCIVDPNTPFDDPIVLTGSHNWSKSANEDNDENTLIVHSYEVANQYFQEWAKRFSDEGGNVFVSRDEEVVSLLTALIINNDLLINIESPQDDQIFIDLYDMHGRLLLQSRKSLMKGKNHIQLTMQNTREAVYVLKVQSGDQIYCQKLIRQ
jgi:phosphatidylserine/phosphatidylglycerophosphate/cardiolipin synthase-like enzyme